MNKQTHRHTHTYMDISTYRKHRPRGPMLWKYQYKKCIVCSHSTSLHDNLHFTGLFYGELIIPAFRIYLYFCQKHTPKSNIVWLQVIKYANKNPEAEASYSRFNTQGLSTITNTLVSFAQFHVQSPIFRMIMIFSLSEGYLFQLNCLFRIFNVFLPCTLIYVLWNH